MKAFFFPFLKIVLISARVMKAIGSSVTPTGCLPVEGRLVAPIADVTPCNE